MNRRDFLRRSALVAAGAIAADQLDLVERLGWKRRLFAGFGLGVPTLYADGVHDDTSAIQAFLCGEKVYDRHHLISGNVLRGGQYRITNTLTANAHRNVEIHDAMFDFDFDATGGGFLFLPYKGRS